MMKVASKVSLVFCLFFLVLGAHAQDGSDFQNLDYELNYDKFCLGPGERHKAPQLKRPASNLLANRPTHVFWNSGTVLLSDGRRVEGFIHLDIIRDLVKVQEQGTIQMYHAEEIVSFELHKDTSTSPQNELDASLEKATFSSFAYPKSSSYKQKLFQVVVEGDMSLLVRRQFKARRPNNKLYLMNSEGRITPIGKKIDLVLESFDSNQDELKELITSEQLDVLNTNDMKRLVQVYNELNDL